MKIIQFDGGAEYSAFIEGLKEAIDLGWTANWSLIRLLAHGK